MPESAVMLRLTDNVLAQHPEADIRVVVASGFDNTARWPAVESALASFSGLDESTTVEMLESDPGIAEWFAAYRKFGTNPRRIRPSVYALLRRVLKDGRLPRISPAVDAYNYVSVTHRVPAGAFDLRKLTSDVDIRFGEQADVFTPLGEPGVEENPNDGEVVYAMSERVLTRHWNHRDSDLTKIDETSTSGVFLLEAAGVASARTLDDASEHLRDLLAAEADRVNVAALGSASPELELKLD